MNSSSTRNSTLINEVRDLENLIAENDMYWIDTICITDEKVKFFYRCNRKDLPYYGIIIKGYFVIPSDYPNSKPLIFFSPVIYHINVRDTGQLCWGNAKLNSSKGLLEAFSLAMAILVKPAWDNGEVTSLAKQWKELQPAERDKKISEKNCLYDRC